MYGLKEAILLKEHYHNEVEVYLFYIDIRTPSKGYEEFYRRAREMGVIFIRGKPSQILEDPKTKNLVIRAEDSTLGQPIEVETELVVLSTAAIPSKGAEELARHPTHNAGIRRILHGKSPQTQTDGYTYGRRVSGGCLPRTKGHTLQCSPRKRRGGKSSNHPFSAEMEDRTDCLGS